MKLTANQKFNAAISLMAGQDYNPKEALEMVERLGSLIPDDSVYVPSKEELDKLFADTFKKHDVKQTTATRLINTIQIETGIKRNQAILYIQTAVDMDILQMSVEGKTHCYKYVQKSSKN